jgi:hypothetical protein
MRGAMDGAGCASKALAWGEPWKAEAARCDRWWSTAAGVVTVGGVSVAEMTVGEVVVAVLMVV